MSLQLFSEPLNGKYDGVAPPSRLPPGWISGGENMRKVSQAGGWKPRKGTALHNTAEIASDQDIRSLHQYTNPKQGDYHFIAQCNSLLYDATEYPSETPGSTFGTSLAVATGTTPGFSCTVGEWWFYADGTSAPIQYGGGAPAPSGFVVYDADALRYVDYTRNVIDGRPDTEAIVVGEATDVFYVISPMRLGGVTLDLGDSRNSNDVTIVVEAWRGGGWVGATVTGDETNDSGTLAVEGEGTISWTASDSDDMQIIGGIMGYVYKFGWSGALSGSVTIKSCTTVAAAAIMTNLWNGVYGWVAGCRFFDKSEEEYQECLGLVSNESTSQYIALVSSTELDFLYIKTFEPATAFGFAIPVDYNNTAAQVIDKVEYWDGDSWDEAADLVDSTIDTPGGSDSYSQTGVLFFDATAIIPQKSTFQGDNIPGYWYRISWDGTMSAELRISTIVYATYPETLPTYDGCVEFKGRLVLWGDPEYPNRLRFSAKSNPNCFSGKDSGYTAEFGDLTPILNVVRFYNELIVFKANGVYMLQGYSPGTFGILLVAATIGLASPQTVVVAEVGFPSMHSEEPLTVVIWQDTDGVYVIDGRKPRKVSLPIDDYFNPELANTIAADSINNRLAFNDPINNEYHLILPAGELVYSYLTDEWYPLWNRAVDLTCGKVLRGTDGRYYTYGGAEDGFVFLLETTTHDKSTGNVSTLIAHSIKTRAYGVEGVKDIALSFTQRKIWAEFLGQALSTDCTVKSFKDVADDGTSEDTTFSAYSASGKLATPMSNLSIPGCMSMQLEFSLATIDKTMEIWAFNYQLEVIGLVGA